MPTPPPPPLLPPPPIQITTFPPTPTTTAPIHPTTTTSWMVEQIQEARAQEEAEKKQKLDAGEKVIINLMNEDGEKSSECGSLKYAEIHRKISANQILQQRKYSSRSNFPDEILRRKYSSRADLSVIAPMSRKSSSMRHRFSDIEKWDLSSRKVTPILLRVPKNSSKDSISSMRIDLMAGEFSWSKKTWKYIRI